MAMRLTSALRARAGRGAVRHLGPHLSRGRGLCQSGGAGGRPRATRRGPGSAAVGHVALAGSRRLRRRRLRRTPTDFVDGVRLRIMQPNLQQDEKFNYSHKQEVLDRYIALSTASTGPQSRPARRHASDLAGIGVSVFPDARSRRAGADRRAAAAGHGADHRRRARARGISRPAVKSAYNSVYVIDHTARSCRSTTRSTWCRSANICRSRTFSKARAAAAHQMRGGFIAGDRHRVLAVPGAPKALPLICYEIIFPGPAMPRGRAAGLDHQPHQ